MNVRLIKKLLIRGTFFVLFLAQPLHADTYYTNRTAIGTSYYSTTTQKLQELTATSVPITADRVQTEHSFTLAQRVFAMLTSLGTGIKNVFRPTKKELVGQESLEVINDLLEVIYALDLDNYKLWDEQLSQFKVYVNGIHVPHETELENGQELAIKVPYTPKEPCMVSFVAPMSIALEMLEHPEFCEYKEQVNTNIRHMIESSRMARWLQSFFSNQQEFVLFASKYLKMQVAFHYTLDAQDLTRNGQLYILTVVANKQWEWKNKQPDFTAQAKSLRTVEVIIHDDSTAA